MARKKKKKGKYKLKTHKATSKRFKMTGSGKIVRTKGNQGHLQRRKSKRAQRLTAEMIEVPVAKTRKNIERLVPYMKKNRK